MGEVENEENSASGNVRSEGAEEKPEQLKTASRVEVVNVDSDGDDDKVANEEFTLNVVEKAMSLKSSKNGSSSNSDGGNFIVLEGDDGEVVTNFIDDKSKKKDIKKRKRKEFEAQLDSVDAAKEEEKAENIKTTGVVEVSDNSVLRKLLRCPRYFDPPDSSWGACYNCGEEGHTAINCTSAKRQRPCFVCGSLEHQGKQCKKGHDCYICRKGGHHAKACPERSNRGVQNSNMCLKCGDSGHDIFSCTNDYPSDDLKEIECYICGSMGHLCCVNYSDSGLKEVTCYRCGLSGHTGLFCSGSQKKTINPGSANSCYKCGEGHVAGECFNVSQSGKKKKKKEKRKKEVISAPPDLGKKRKHKKRKLERGLSSAAKPKGKHGWDIEHPGDYADNHRATRWRSPATPNGKIFRMPDYATNHASTSYTPWQCHTPHPASNGTPSFNQPRYGSWNPHYSASQSPSSPAPNGTPSFSQPRYGSWNPDYSASHSASSPAPNGTPSFNQPTYGSWNPRYSTSLSPGSPTPNATPSFNQPRDGSWYPGYSASHSPSGPAPIGTPSFNQPRYGSWKPQNSVPHRPGTQLSNIFPQNSGYSAYNESSQLYQNRLESNFHNSSNFASRGDHHF